jgi:hypothetical protein
MRTSCSAVLSSATVLWVTGHVIFDAETRLAKTKLNGVNREIAGVLLAAKAFLCRGGDEFPVNYESRGRIVTLGDAVLPRIQSRPTLLLERSRSSKPLIPKKFTCPSRKARRQQSGFARLTAGRQASRSC